MPRDKGWLDRAARWVERHELWLVVAGALLILLPGLWAFQLIDPWETHYSEVARRMLQDHDWIFLKWQNESFRSKPVLTSWLIGSSFSLLGVARGGGYSGELVQGRWPEMAARLPFALFGAFGLVMAFWMLRRLVSRRAAWLGFGVLATTPFYILIARQAITDVPMVACLIAAVACFAMMVHQGQAPPARWQLWAGWLPGPIRRRVAPEGRLAVTGEHVLLGALTAFVSWQSIYLLFYFHRLPQLAPGLRVWHPGWLLAGGSLVGLVVLLLWSLRWRPIERRGQIYMHWFYVLVGVSILGKGPVEPGVLGLVCLFYLVLTGRWRLLRRIEIFQGVVIAALICVPWHVAMYFKDGLGWAHEYFIFHIWDRFFQGVDNATGTWNYYSSQLGVGMWPWAALLPAALTATLARRNRATPAGDMRLLVGIWAVAGFFFFGFSSTKFHYYILPAVPAFALLIGFWLDDVLDQRAGRVTLLALLAAVLSLLATRDLLGDQKQIVELFCFMYGRPWPGGPPWNVDVTTPVFWFGIAAAACFVVMALPWRKTRVASVVGLGLTALGFTLWAANGYMHVTAPHWGQRHLWRTYYRERAIHGLEIRYGSLHDVTTQWGPGGVYHGDVPVRSVLPDGFTTGMPMTVRLLLPGSGLPGDKLELRGRVSRVGHDRFWIAIDPAERAKLAPLMKRGAHAPPSSVQPWSQVDADRMITWQLNWRGENFWSSGEIWGQTPDTQTVFTNNDAGFKKYVADPARRGRRFFLITEAGRNATLPRLLPSDHARKTLKVIDRSCNKYTMVSFEL